MNSEARPKLHVACGTNLLVGWINSDLSILNRQGRVYVDARDTLPFPDSSLCAIYNEHFISLLELECAVAFFRECLRVLRPGGVLRTASAGWPLLMGLAQRREAPYVEYAAWAAHEFVGVTSPPCLAHMLSILAMNNYIYGFGLRFIHDPESVAWALNEGGFQQVQSVRVGESEHAELCGIEGHGAIIPAHLNELETFVLEATKA